MRAFKIIILSLLFSFLLAPGFALAVDEHCLVGLQGYDPVSYFQKSGPLHGDGNHEAFYEGVSYIFATDSNKKAFQANPAKYLPAYGGYCAFGVSAGRKVFGDPLSWKIVDSKLYLNLNKKVQKIWLKDIPLYIKQADNEWVKIKDQAAERL
jgi:YHS domain-containing protein